MPELKPCPACGNVESIIHMSFIAGKTIWFVECDDDNCAHHGKACFTEAAAIAAWNSPPRALTWTAEPPNVPGWYWFSVCNGHAVCILVCADGKAKLAKDHFTDAELLGGEWAGPIPTPLEPGES
ncbi:Lar family restriction alleviation protein [Desulfovibrio falkowii]|uniref:Uncharacterized protein n=1 Tax=Desulfovibrio falkowii TaxID=3136602 RepID=A0ABQ0E9P9_9BACT